MQRPSARAGYTLIEILIVVAIIGILAAIILVLLTGSTDKASANKVKTELGSVKNAMAICCSNPTTTLGTTAGGAVCTGATGVLPTSTELESTGVTYSATSCGVSSPTYTVTLSGHKKTECNGAWTVNYTGVTTPAGC